MEPAITIVDYLWDSRKTWFKHENPNGCVCTFEEMVQEFLDQVNVVHYLGFDDYVPRQTFRYRTAGEWDLLVGPTAQQKALSELADQYMSAAAEIISMQATNERLAHE